MALLTKGFLWSLYTLFSSSNPHVYRIHSGSAGENAFKSPHKNPFVNSAIAKAL